MFLFVCLVEMFVLVCLSLFACLRCLFWSVFVCLFRWFFGWLIGRGVGCLVSWLVGGWVGCFVVSFFSFVVWPTVFVTVAGDACRCGC